MDEMKKLTENEELMKGLVEATTPEELVELLKKNNIALEEGLTPEEAFKMVKSQEEGELGAADLDGVNGGVIGAGAAILATGGLVVGGLTLCYLGGYAYQTYKNYKKK